MSYFVQNPLLPYVSLENLRPVYIRDLTTLDNDTKQYALETSVVLNTLFDTPKLKADLGLSYYTLISYFNNKDFLQVIPDETGQLYKQCKINASNILSNITILYPVNYTINTQNIIQTVEDFSDRQKLIETLMLLANYYCSPNFESITFDYAQQIQSGGFMPGV